MKVDVFEMERFQSEWENRVTFNLSESGVHPMSVDELLDPGERARLLAQPLVYVQTNGTPALRETVAGLYPGASADNVVVGNGGAEANFIAIWRLIDPGDEVVMMVPNYMQIWGLVRGRAMRMPAGRSSSPIFVLSFPWRRNIPGRVIRCMN